MVSLRHFPKLRDDLGADKLTRTRTRTRFLDRFVLSPWPSVRGFSCKLCKDVSTHQIRQPGAGLKSDSSENEDLHNMGRIEPRYDRVLCKKGSFSHSQVNAPSCSPQLILYSLFTFLAQFGENRKKKRHGQQIEYTNRQRLSPSPLSQ